MYPLETQNWKTGCQDKWPFQSGNNVYLEASIAYPGQ